MEDKVLPHLILLRGLPGKIKDAALDRIIKFSETTDEKGPRVLSTSTFFELHETEFDKKMIGPAHDWCYASTMLLLHRGTSVIVANTFVTTRELNRYILGVQRSGISILSDPVVVSIPPSEDTFISKSSTTKMNSKMEPFKNELILTLEDLE